MRVLLLGGNGLLGHNVAQQLLSQGHTVRALVRKAEGLHVDCEKVQGSFLDYACLLKAAQGCEAIINCAGCTDMSLLRLEDYLPANSQGVKTLCDVAETLGISRLVHTSTANTIGYGSPSSMADETAPMQFPFSESYYAQSKLEGERHIQALAQRHPDWHIITVNPGFMFGPCDWRNSSGRLLRAAYRKPIMLAPKGGKSFIPVRDAAKAIVNAMESGRNGQRYLLTGRNMALKDFYRLQARTCGYKQLILSPPNGLMLALAKVGDLVRLIGIRTQISSRNIRQLLVREYYDNSLATSELHMPQSPLEDSILAYFDKKNW